MFFILSLWRLFQHKTYAKNSLKGASDWNLATSPVEYRFLRFKKHISGGILVLSGNKYNSFVLFSQELMMRPSCIVSTHQQRSSAPDVRQIALPYRYMTPYLPFSLFSLIVVFLININSIVFDIFFHKL